MKDWKRICKSIFCPPWWLTALLAVAGGGGLAVVFRYGWEETPGACCVYALSFYALTAVCVACATTLPGFFRRLKARVDAVPVCNRYRTDVAFKTHVSLVLSLGINLLYAGMNLISGVSNRSPWFITLATYYMILAAMRFLLLGFVSRNGIGRERVPELRRARLCGGILMALNLALSGVVILVIRRREGFEYTGMLIYVMAMYAFYATVSAVVNLIRYRTYNSPVLSTARAINLAAALVSMLSLEIAMLSRFGSEKNAPNFDQIMIAVTGAGVCAIVIFLSASIILRTNREIRRYENEKNSLV